ncbi:mitochondrial ribonuclease P catalytic subunit isoform X1 [Frieseomelitta varia]|uniref:mitochondrial ribonuclease P catalytic subunit isoform X1 n=1 Tax=Frieseomelitta varia TaxID=561572 RepID=UPI001CB67B1C|nr:mitochondrial ribonuclease P catalytic subunit isoform X1 [Frieseomelitta varia]
MFSHIRRTLCLFSSVTRSTFVSNVKNMKQDTSEICWNYFISNYGNTLVQSNTISKEVWENVRKHMMKLENDPLSADFVILNMFQQRNYPDAGMSYYRFLKNNNYNITVPLITKYLQCLTQKSNLSETDKEHILSLYNDIASKYTLFNVGLSNVFISCLCKIDNWEEAANIIKKHEEIDKSFLCCGYSSLISYFFEHGKEELGYEYLDRSLKYKQNLLDIAYSSYLKYCLKEKNTFNNKVEKLFSLWNEYAIKPTENIVQEYMNACIEQGWSVNATKIFSLICQNCKQKLSQLSLSDDEYEYLLKATKEQLIFTNMYYVTVPKEIQSYMKFIDKNKPYDIILDGLNFMYFAKYNNHLETKFINMFKSLKSQNKKILIIGRKHIKKYIKRTGLDVADYYYVENSSKDDLFMLYAAFASGENAKIITKDLMRQHIFALRDTKLSGLFKKWQLSHQLVLDKQGYSQLSEREIFDAIVQKQNNYWHVPYLKRNIASQMRHTSIDDWMCFKMNE